MAYFVTPATGHSSQESSTKVNSIVRKAMCDFQNKKGKLCIKSKHIIVSADYAETLWLEGCYGLSPSRDERKKVCSFINFTNIKKTQLKNKDHI